ncbi:MAG: hypothetical protein AB2A00_13270 [Myxococcota bacterium]
MLMQILLLASLGQAPDMEEPSGVAGSTLLLQTSPRTSADADKGQPWAVPTPAPGLTHAEPPESRFLPRKLLYPLGLATTGLAAIVGLGAFLAGAVALIGGVYLRGIPEGREEVDPRYAWLGVRSELAMTVGALLVGVMAAAGLVGYAGLGIASASEEEALHGK